MNPLELLKQHSLDNIGAGEPESRIVEVETKLGIRIPDQYRHFLKEVGYAEIFGDELYSIYEDTGLPNLGLLYMNRRNELLEKGFLMFFSNDIDGIFYFKIETGEVFLNDTDFRYATSFNQFVEVILKS